MAKINNLIKGTGKVSKKFSEVECVYTTGNVDGEKYIVLSTYGSSDRKNKSSASQVLHINKEIAQLLIDLLKKEFYL